jgi:hypothetical protein
MVTEVSHRFSNVVSGRDSVIKYIKIASFKIIGTPIHVRLAVSLQLKQRR